MASGECSKKQRLGLQTKLKVNEPGDIYEQEADRVADQVLETPAHPVVSGAPPRIQRFSGRSNGQMDTAPASVDQALASPGRPLDPALRQDMEQRFGRDFSQVRVNSGGAAEQSARDMNANAYTVGQNIVFGAGRFAPGTHEGRRLIAHELTHVVQQSGADGLNVGQSYDKRGLSPIIPIIVPLLPPYCPPIAPASRPKLQRQPTGREVHGVSNALTDADRREFVRDATAHFTRAAQYYATHAVDAATFERVINAWYALLANQEELIKELGGDVMLTRALQAAYTDAIRVLMKQAALLFNRPQADLYRENSGRIPVWAWLQPHHMESFITTPIPEGRSSNPLTGAGEVNFNVNGWDVTIKPDDRDPGVSGAETRLHFDPGSIPLRFDASGKVSPFTVPTPAATIQTFYGHGATTISPSAYGRGTTTEDVAGGRVTPHSTSLGFHEGHHGLDYVEFLESNPPPVFTGAPRQTNAQFTHAITSWQAPWAALNANANRLTTRRTECVGSTIDQFKQAQGGGATVTLVCVP